MWGDMAKVYGVICPFLWGEKIQTNKYMLQNVNVSMD